MSSPNSEDELRGLIDALRVSAGALGELRHTVQRLVVALDSSARVISKDLTRPRGGLNEWERNLLPPDDNRPRRDYDYFAELEERLDRGASQTTSAPGSTYRQNQG